MRRAARDVSRFWGDERRALKVGAIALLIAATADLAAGLFLSGAEGEPLASASGGAARLWATPEEAWTDHLDHLDHRLENAIALAAKVLQLRADAGQARAAWRARPADMENAR